MNASFIRVAELWVPSADGALLEFDRGLFGRAAAFAALSRTMCFGRGEGLPGRVWDEGRPILLRQFEGVGFRRAAAARAAGLTCALALPFFVDGALKAVLVLFGGHDGAVPGGLELWHHNARLTTDMTLIDGVYGANADPFEAASRETFLPRGVGLPGRAWQRGEAVFIDGLADSRSFLRSAEAAEAGMQQGLALPCRGRTDDAYVAVVLASREMPIARHLERWTLGDDGASLRRQVWATDGLPADPADAEVAMPLDDGLLGRAVAERRPMLSAAAASEPGPVGRIAAARGLAPLLAIPVLDGDAVTEVIALYL